MWLVTKGAAWPLSPCPPLRTGPRARSQQLLKSGAELAILAEGQRSAPPPRPSHWNAMHATKLPLHLRRGTRRTACWIILCRLWASVGALPQVNHQLFQQRSLFGGGGSGCPRTAADQGHSSWLAIANELDTNRARCADATSRFGPHEAALSSNQDLGGRYACHEWEKHYYMARHHQHAPPA
jgi:hypothetical protein